MTTRFELICETVHCFGKQVFVMGSVESEVEAQAWKEAQQSMEKKPALPETDASRSCPVVRCPLKLQPCRFSYRRVEKD